MRNLAAVCFFIAFISCKGKNDLPAGILPEKKMQEVFWDFVKADVYAFDHIRHDSTKNAAIENLKLQNSIFKLHHVTREEFYKSYTYYSNHKELMSTMIDSMLAKQQRDTSKSRLE